MYFLFLLFTLVLIMEMIRDSALLTKTHRTLFRIILIIIFYRERSGNKLLSKEEEELLRLCHGSNPLVDHVNKSPLLNPLRQEANKSSL